MEKQMFQLPPPIKTTSAYRSTITTTNYARVVRCILGPCTDMFRELLQQQITPPELQAFIQKHMYVCNALDNHQKITIGINFKTGSFTCSPNYKEFDISIMYILVRTPGVLKTINAPSKGWGRFPSPNEVTIGDDIERLRWYKNEICSHISKPEIHTPKFNDTIRKLKEICKRFDSLLSSNTSYETSIDAIENMYMDSYFESCCLDMLHIVQRREEQLDKLCKRLENHEQDCQCFELIFDLLLQRDKDNGFTSTVFYQAKATTELPRLKRMDELKIKSNYEYLLCNIAPVTILEKVCKKGIISDPIREDIESASNKKHKADKILKSLLRSSPPAYATFLEILKSEEDKMHQDIVARLENIQKDETCLKTDNGITSVNSESDSESEYRLRLGCNYERIIDEIDAWDMFHQCFENEIISMDEHDSIFYEYARKKRNAVLLNSILSKLPSSYEFFISTLKQLKRHAGLLQQIENTDIHDVQAARNKMPKMGLKLIETLKVSDQEKMEIYPKSSNAKITVKIFSENGEISNDDYAIIVHKCKEKEQETGNSVVHLHGTIGDMKKACIEITLSAVSPLFLWKIHHACENGNIKDFLKSAILDNIPEDMLVFSSPQLVKVKVECDAYNEIVPETEQVVREIVTDLEMFRSILIEEVDALDIRKGLENNNLITEEESHEIFNRSCKSSEEKMNKIIDILTSRSYDVLSVLAKALEDSKYVDVAEVLMGKPLHDFAIMSESHLRLCIAENFQILLEELDIDKLASVSQCMQQISSSTNGISNGTRMNKTCIFLKAILQNEYNSLWQFFRSLNGAGYRSILKTMSKTENLNLGYHVDAGIYKMEFAIEGSKKDLLKADLSFQPTSLREKHLATVPEKIKHQMKEMQKQLMQFVRSKSCLKKEPSPKIKNTAKTKSKIRPEYGSAPKQSVSSIDEDDDEDEEDPNLYDYPDLSKMETLKRNAPPKTDLEYPKTTSDKSPGPKFVKTVRVDRGQQQNIVKPQFKPGIAVKETSSIIQIQEVKPVVVVHILPQSHSTHNVVPTRKLQNDPPSERGKPRDIKRQSSSTFSNLSVTDVVKLLKSCRLTKMAEKCNEQTLDGKILCSFDDQDLQDDFSLSAIKLKKFKLLSEDNWTPKLGHQGQTSPTGYSKSTFVFSDLSVMEVLFLLRANGLNKMADECEEESLDGRFLSNCDHKELKEYFSLNAIEMKKFELVKKDGYTPRVE